MTKFIIGAAELLIIAMQLQNLTTITSP